MIQNFDYNGQLIQRRADGFVNLTQMCQANGKLLGNWNNLKSTKSYLEAVSSDIGITISELLVIKKGNSAEFTQGTWGHPLIALHLAQWISPSFHVWCNAHIFNLMASGSTSIEINPVEEMKLKLELAKLENDKVQAELKLLQLRQYVATALPELVQQKVLGYSTVKEIEYRDRIIQDDQIINDGSTVNKTELCKRYGFMTKSGNPDYKKLNKHLESIKIPDYAWENVSSVRENQELRRDYLEELDKKILDDSRQLWFGE
jgi:hypothetical protein